MQEYEEVTGGLKRDRSKAGGAESVDLLHEGILALSRPFCKLPAGRSETS
jgi:hypothetical protein